MTNSGDKETEAALDFLKALMQRWRKLTPGSHMLVLRVEENGELNFATVNSTDKLQLRPKPQDIEELG